MTDNKKVLHCAYCNFLTTNKTNWKQHLLTSKHAKKSGCLSVKPKKSQKNVKNEHVKNTIIWHTCDICGKNYRYKSGLSRHRKKCQESMEQMEQSIVISTEHQDKKTIFENHQL